MNQNQTDQSTIDAFEETLFVVSEPFLAYYLKPFSILLFLILLAVGGYLGDVLFIPYTILLVLGLVFCWVLRTRYHFDLFEMSYKNDYSILGISFGGKWTKVPKPSYYTSKMETTRFRTSSPLHGQATGMNYNESVWKIFVHSPRGKAYLLYENAEKTKVVQALSTALDFLDLPVYSGIKREDRLILRAGIHNGKLALVHKKRQAPRR
ncbi:hypothetical protein KFE98_00105 [bacterium SCSIO 12741]|nr:hypothetical protein KFE98_00105 [bacterium SCSIO 12741]